VYFAYNNGNQETIKSTAFFTNYGINPEYNMIGHLLQGKQVEPKEIRKLDESLRKEMVAAQLRQAEYYDLHRKPDPNLQSEAKVRWVPCNIKMARASRKMDYKSIGPFKILAKIGTSGYKLALPPGMAINNMCHICPLEPYQAKQFRSQIKEPAPPI